MDMSDREKIYIAKLSIPGTANNELSYVFTDRTDTAEREGSPVLFGIFHLFETAPIYHALIKETAKNFLDFFHRSRHSITDDLQTEFDSSEFLFENAIQYTNEHVTEFLLAEQEAQPRTSSCDIRKVNFTLGALFGDLLFLSTTGSQIHPLYIYPVFRKGGFSHYAVLPIGDDGKEDTAAGRLFSNILSGKLAITGSTFVMCNRNFLDYISVEQIKQAVTNMSIQNVAGYFEGLLSKVHGKHDFSAIFINPHYTGPIPKAERTSIGTATNRSMAGLNSTASGTTTILSPSALAPLKPLLVSVLRFLFSMLHSVGRLLRRGAIALWTVAKKIIEERKFSPRDIAPFVAQAKASAVRAVGNIRAGVVQVVNPATRSLVIEKTKLILRERLIAISELNRASKAILALCIIFAVLFLQSVISLKAKQAAESELQAYQDAVRAIELKVDLAEASLLYENGERAQSITADASRLLEALPSGTQFPTDRAQKIAKRIDGIRARLSKQILIQSPKKIASFAETIPNASSSQLLLVGSLMTLFTADGVYAVDQKTGAVSLVDTQAKLPSIHCASAIDGKRAYFCIGDANKLGLVSIRDNAVTTLTVDFADNEKSLRKIALYNKRLYVLDPESNMIYRHEKKDDVFGKGTPWLKHQADLAGATDFALDGTVFVLTSGNSIRQFSAGRETAFPLPAIEPPLAAVTRIATSDELAYLFLLEPSEKRIVVIDKKTKELKYQLTSDAFTDLSDFSPTKKDITVINGTDLLRFPLP